MKKKPAKIEKIIVPKEFEQDYDFVEQIIYDKMVEDYTKILLVAGILLGLAVIF